MSFKSLQSKIFVLVTIVLVVVAITVMTTSRRNVSETVIASEQHAINDVLDLIQHELAARWATLLENKVSIVRHGRHQLMQTGKIIEKTLGLYAQLADKGILTTAQAQQLAIDWINELHFDGDHYAFILNKDDIVIASGDPKLISLDLSTIKDFKNRQLAHSVKEESKVSGYSFSLYHRPSNNTSATLSSEEKIQNTAKDDNFRYAYFGYFNQWNWSFAVSDSAANVIKQIEANRTQMELSVRDTVLPLAPTESGFIFIVDSDGRFIAKPPNDRKKILSGRLNNDESLNKYLRDHKKADLHAATLNTAQGIWQINSRYYAPLRWTIVAAVPQDALSSPARTLLHSQAIIFSSMLILTLFITWGFTAHIVRPLRRLTEFVRQLPDQALHASVAVPLHIAMLPERNNDEVGRLAAAFLHMNSKLRDNINDLMRETTARERFESELHIARSIQLGLLPPPLSEASQQIELSAIMRPAKQVGGDIYDYFFLPNGKLCIIIGDVSDKGVPAALFMAVTRTLIRATAEDEIEPERIVNKVNERLSENNPHMMFVTLIVGTLDLDSGAFQWVNAGHIAPVVISSTGLVRTLQGRSGPACGVQEGISYTTYQTQLQRGEMLIGYTDGVTENLNLTQEQYGDERMLGFLTKHHASTAAAIETLVQDLDAFSAGADQADDITILAIQRK